MKTIRNVEIETAFLSGQRKFWKGTTLPDLPLPTDEELAAAMIAGWRRCHEADPANFGRGQ